MPSAFRSLRCNNFDAGAANCLRWNKDAARPGLIVQSMSNERTLIEPACCVDEVMRRWPATIRTFLDFRMNCVGCPIATFHTVEDACREHGVSCDRLLTALQAAAVRGDGALATPRAVPRPRRRAHAHRE